MGIAGRSPGGRPLRRRREMVSIYGRQRLRGTAALQASTEHRSHERKAIAGRFPGGRPLRRHRETVQAIEPLDGEGQHPSTPLGPAE
jgi:hypothetical protein